MDGTEIRVNWFRNKSTGQWDKWVNGEFTLQQALDRIRNGASRELIEQIRPLATKDERDKVKFWLPAVTFAGTFKDSRKNENLLHASGLACMDWDHLGDPEMFRDFIIENDYILAAWVSPSGDGVKALVKIPKVKNDAEYKQYYESLLQEFPDANADKKTKDVQRLCFESWDPDIKTKEFKDAKLFEKKIIKDTRPDQQPAPIKVNDKIFNDCLAKLAGRGDVYTIGNRENYIHDLACETNRAGIPEDQAKECVLNLFRELEERETIAALSGVYTRNADEFNNNNKGNAELQAMVEAARIDVTKPRPDEPYILTINGQSIASLGSFTLTTGKAKSRKTHYNTYLAATCLRGEKGKHAATLTPDKSTVIYFDTEQSGGEAWDAAYKIIKAAGLSTMDKLLYYSLRTFTPEERTKSINQVITTTPGAGVVFIDGIRDLVNNINDPTEATQATTALMQWTKEYNVHIFCTLHLNKSDGNARGHLGTELVNKAQTIIEIKKPEDGQVYSIVKFEDGRGQAFDDFALGYDDEGLPVEGNLEDFAPAKPGKQAFTPASIPLNDYCQKLEKIIPKDGLKYKELQTEIHEAYNKGMNAAGDIISYLVQEADLIYKKDGKYFYKAPHQAKEIKQDKSDKLDDDTLPF